MMPELSTLRNFAIILIFTVLFGTAAFDKVKTLQTPDWFVKQFTNTFISKMPGGAAVGYWVVAFFESLLTIAFIASSVKMEILPFALTGALFLFGMLCFGLRVISDFQGSANMFIYFAATLISLHLIS